MEGRIMILVLTAAISLLSSVVCEKEETLIRIRSFNSGNSYRTIVGESMIVSVFLDSSMNMVDCHIVKKNTTASRQFYKELILLRETSDVSYITTLADVKRLGRKCKKFVRDTKRKKDNDLSEKDRVAKERLSLDELVEGTKWCTRIPKESRKESVGSNKQLDKCCMSYQKCDHKIEAFTLGYGIFNPFPWPIASCDCMSTLKSCLKEDGSKEALKFGRSFINNMQLPCFTLAENDFCEEYNDWWESCVTWSKKPKAELAYTDNM